MIERMPDRRRSRPPWPWDGDVRITVDTEADFSLYLRVPGWCDSRAIVAVNGQPTDGEPSPGSYVEISRRWKPGDIVDIQLPMPVRLVESHPYLFENTGRVAVFRGPLLYCLEEAGNSGIDPRDSGVAGAAAFEVEWRSDLLGGINVLTTTASIRPMEKSWNSQLYRPIRDGNLRAEPASALVELVPYFAWANREPGRMEVWLRRQS